jgi:DNA repair exonuclease SbcCD ATPase subunit
MHPEMGKAFKPIEDCDDYTALDEENTSGPVEEEYTENQEVYPSNSIIPSTVTVLTKRTPDLIAAEINDIKGQTRRMVLYNSIEIGRRLVEAKSLLDHGEWGTWLEESVNYSQRTAENLMRVFEEYGSDQITFLTDNSKSQAFANLSYSQAVLLLGVPEEDREAFIVKNDVENMSTRELQQAIKDRDQALAEKEQAEQDKENAISEMEKAKEDAQSAEDKINSLINEKDSIKKQLDDASKKADENQVKIQRDLEKAKKDLEKKESELNKAAAKIKELESKPLEVNPGATPEDIEKIKSETAARYEKDLAVLKTENEQAEKRAKELEIKATQNSNAAALRYKVYFETITKDFAEILNALSDIKDTDSETYERYKKATADLIGKMTERL